MAIKTPCISCGRTLSAPDTAAGKRARCPSCGTIQQLPGGEPPMDVLEPEPVAEPVYDNTPEDPFAQNDAPSDEYAMAAEAPPLPAGGGATGGGGGEERRPCPMCGEMIPAKALKCRFCNTIFDPALRKAESKRKKSGGGGGSDDDLTAGEWVACFLCSGITCIIGLVWMIQGKPKGKKMFFVSLAVQGVAAAIRAAVQSS
jgi:predicted RNA-binding Zn-ribbon protein involved in translation (DUF1610 family)